MVSRGLKFLILTFAIILLSRSVVGKLNYIKTKSGWMRNVDPYRRQLIELQNHGDGFSFEGKPSNSRSKRATTGQPVASAPYILRGDNHRFANVHYSGDESDVVFVLTYDTYKNGSVGSSSLYRSENYGKTFVIETSKFPLGSRLHPRYHVSEDKQTIIFADDISRTVYVSKDEGDTYTHYSVPVNPKSLLYHPTKKEWVLGFDDIQNELKMSQDLGQNWTSISVNVRSTGDYSWGVPGVDWRIDSGETRDLSKVYYNTYDPSNSHPGEADDIDVSLMISHYPYEQSDSEVFDSNLGLHDAFLILDKYIFVQRTVNEENNEVELLVSYNRGPFNVARIPFEDAHQNYFVGIYRSAQVLVVIRHTSGLDNLYFSDETGTYYSLSLYNIILDVQNGLDLELIDSMNGTFIANRHVSSTSIEIETIISFDNGAEWHLLPAPEVTVGNEETNCEVPSCSLHLHLYSTDFSRLGVYSRSSAPGIIIAQGNYGQSLSSNPSDIDLYISRDGGLRWDQTLAGSWDVQIIDHGGLLVAAKDYHQQEETYIMYSCNEGRSWVNFTFTDTSTVIWGVVTEPGETTTEATLFGSEDRRHLEWAIISISFAGVFQRNCTARDYWNWTVSDGRIEEQTCLLGESRVFERRRTEICCLSGEKYERIISASPCDCAREDFECDWGYRPDDIDGGVCVTDDAFTEAEEDRGNQQCITGYRKIAGDSCVKGISDDLLECTPSGKTATSQQKSATLIYTKSSNEVSIAPTKAAASINDKSNNTGVIVLAIFLVIAILVIITLGTVVIYMARRLLSVSQGGYQPAATRSNDDDDDDALLRP